MALIFQEKVDEAEQIFRNILDNLSPSGLLAEEINPDTGEQLGNYPQAFSHVGLINAALYLGKAKTGKQQIPELLSHEG